MFYLNVEFVKQNWISLILVLTLEISTYVVSYLKFRKTIATHSILAKIWTVSMLVFLIDLTLNHESSWAFYLCIGLGVISRLEILLIILKLDNWATDIPSIWVVGKMNRDERIKKNKLFNS